VLTVTLDVTNRKAYLQNQNAYTRHETLTPATAELFGLGADSTPNDALAFLGKYNLHWWKMRGYGAHYETLVQSNDETCTISVPSSSGADFYYSSSITISQTDGKISLVNPQSFHVEWGQGSYDKAIGKYVCRNAYQNVDSVLKFDKDVTYSAYGSDSSLVTTFKGGVQTIIGVYVEETTDWQFVYSEDSEAYPKSGVVNGFEYQYLGIPFDNAVTAPKIATGSYIGTGVYGASNPNRLTFDFVPKIWGFYAAEGGGVHVAQAATMLVWGANGSWLIGRADSPVDIITTVLSYSGNTVSFYSTQGSYAQNNNQGYIYYYFAIG